MASFFEKMFGGAPRIKQKEIEAVKKIGALAALEPAKREADITASEEGKLLLRTGLGSGTKPLIGGGSILTDPIAEGGGLDIYKDQTFGKDELGVDMGFKGEQLLLRTRGSGTESASRAGPTRGLPG